MKMIKLLMLAFSLLYFIPEVDAQKTLKLDSLFSDNIGETRKFYVLHPSDYQQRSYPILYVLHGAWGRYTNWIEKTKIQDHAHDLPVILVFPDASNSFYVNSVANEDKRYADYILKDLFQYAEQKYQADTLHRGIAGLSMGGYGAFYLATKAPERFTFAAGLSSALSAPGKRYQTPTENELKNPLVQMVVQAFGMPDEEIYPLYHPPTIAANIPNESLPYFYLVHGIQDGYKDFLPAHREIAQTFSERDIAFEYHEVPGKHDWEFWNKHMPDILNKFIQLTGQK